LTLRRGPDTARPGAVYRCS